MRAVFSVVVAAFLLASQNVAAGTLDRVRAAGVFKIGYRTDAPPFSYNSAIGVAGLPSISPRGGGGGEANSASRT
jgi:ABC-type amino acid transport substrate-binding protein